MLILRFVRVDLLIQIYSISAIIPLIRSQGVQYWIKYL